MNNKDKILNTLIPNRIKTQIKDGYIIFYEKKINPEEFLKSWNNKSNTVLKLK